MRVSRVAAPVVLLVLPFLIAASTAFDPFEFLGPPKANPKATPYRFETGPRVPKPDNVSVEAFPPVATPAKPGATPAPPELKVLRTQPAGSGKGNAAMIGAVTATFNQPMIPLAALEDVKSFEIPMVIEPKVAGRFRWLGTTTVSFEPEGRMPFATKYTATVAAGTKSAQGKTLATGVTWTFDTPRPTVVAKFPAEKSTFATPETVVALAFDQKMDPAVVTEFVTLSGPNGKVSMTPVPPSEWAAATKAANLGTWDPERSVVLRPKTPLEKDTAYRVEIAAGLKGAEGPLVTLKRTNWGFRTYAPLKVLRLRCGWDKRCPPYTEWHLFFNNPLDPAQPLNERMKVEPAEAEAEFSASGSAVSIAGTFLPARKYTVTAAPEITDVFGQKLGKEWTGSRTTEDAPPKLDFAAQGVAVAEAKGNRTIALSATNVFDARLRVKKVGRDEIRKYMNPPYSWEEKDPLAGAKNIVVDRKLSLPTKRNDPARVGIPLDDALGAGKPGLVYLDLYSADLHKRDRRRGLLVQVTDIGLAVKYDVDQILVVATGIDDGKPLADLELEVFETQFNAGQNVTTSWWKGKTGKDGLATIPGSRSKPYWIGSRQMQIHATRGDDFAFLDLNGSGQYGWVRGYSYPETFPETMLRPFLFSDRGIYRPEETVHVKGILRQLRLRPGGGISGLPEDAKTVSWSVRSPRGEELLKGDAKLSAYDSFTFDVPLPRGADLGWYYVYGTLKEGTGLVGTAFNGTFQVQEYRAPEYKVEVDTGSTPWLFGQTLAAKVEGRYYFGAPLAGAEVSWTLSRARGQYAPPGNDGFSFGDSRWNPWGGFGYEMDYDESPRGRGYSYNRHAPAPFAAQGAGRLDDHGVLAVSAKLEREEKDESKGPGSFTLEAQVFDQNRQAIAARSSFVVHPSETYVGLRLNKAVVREKEKVPLDVIATSIDGTRVETSVDVAMIEQAWKQKVEKNADGSWTSKWEKKETEIARCAVKTAPRGGGPGQSPGAINAKPCAMVAPRAGYFLLRATAKDAAGRDAVTVSDLYVYGTSAVTWRTDNANRIELVPDKKEYAVGDVAKILLKSPFPRGEGLVTYDADGILEAKRMTLEGTASVIEVPITEKHVPNLHVSLMIARGRLTAAEMPEGASASEDFGRPSFATGEADLQVSRAPKTITIIALPSKKEAGPGETIELAISLTDPSGKPAAGDAAVMLVDEGVLALLGYQTPDPLAAFWPVRQSGATILDLRNLLLKQEKNLSLALRGRKPGDRAYGEQGMNFSGNLVVDGLRAVQSVPGVSPDSGAESLSIVSQTKSRSILGGAFKRKSEAPAREENGRSGGSGYGGQPQAIQARTDFASTAFYAGSVDVPASGLAKLSVKLPDNLTTFRIMVIAADSTDRFGRVDGQVVVKKQILVRPSLPRFLNFGDSFEAAMVVHNETGKPGHVEVLARGVNIAFDEPNRKEVFLKAGESTEVRWKARAVDTGSATVQFAAALGSATDAAEITIPVKLPATGEAFATYGVTETSLSQPMLLPENVIPEFGGLEVRTSSTALTSLGDAVDYLYEYPYECLEQTASRILPIFALKDVIKDFRLGVKPGEEDPAKKADRLAKEGIDRIVSLQTWNGGFKFWPGSEYKTDPWSSGYATFVLLRAKEAGYAVPEQTLQKAKYYLQAEGLNPSKKWGEYWRRAVQVQSVLVLTEMGERPTTVLSELYEAREKLPLFSRAHLMVSLHRVSKTDPRVAELQRIIDNAAVETPSAAHYAEVRTESRALKLLMHSEARTDAIILWSMIESRPKDTLITKVVKGLNDSRVKGRWRTTQENAWVLLAMSRYYKTFEKQAPEFVARAWMEDRFMGETKFAGRTMEVKEINIPMEQLLADAGTGTGSRNKSLLLAKDGPGRLYYRLGLKYAPKNLRLPPEEQGFSVTRVYEGAEDEKDVTRAADGKWIVKAGATVRVRLTIVVPDRRYYAAIVDPLPAGLEGVNAALATTAHARPSAGVDRTYDTWSWYGMWAFDHIQMRDDRVEVFADDLPAGVYEYTYLARATTYGEYVVPPLKAEEMYSPEVFGRNGTAMMSVR